MSLTVEALEKSVQSAQGKTEIVDLIKEAHRQINLQKEKLAQLELQVKTEQDQGNIAEYEAMLEEIKYYEKKIEREKVIAVQTKGAIQAQNRLLNQNKIGPQGTLPKATPSGNSGPLKSQTLK